MSELENEELRDEISKLRDEISKLRDEIGDLRYSFERFAEPCAIGSEQLWEIVRKDIQGLPVPNGVNLRNLI